MREKEEEEGEIKSNEKSIIRSGERKIEKEFGEIVFKGEDLEGKGKMELDGMEELIVIIRRNKR